MYCGTEGLCEVAPGRVKQWVCHAFSSCTSRTQAQRPNIQKGTYQHPQIHHGLQTLCLPEKQWKKEQWSIPDPALQECSSSQRKQLLRNKCFGQDGTRKQEARPLSSRSSCLVRYVPNKLGKHHPNTVYMVFSKSVLNSYCVSWLLCVIHWDPKDQGELCELYFYKAQHENCSK